jgi:DNA-binding response OmpR family regulator
MTTALDDIGNVMAAFKGLCDAYLMKPIEKANLLAKLKSLHLIS